MAKKLFIPGPIDVSPDVLAKMSEPMIGHRGKDFSRLMMSATGKLKKLMFTENTVFLSTSSSTGLMEAAVRNCVGKKCLNIGNGAFSDRWHEITTSNAREADFLSLDWGKAVTAEIVDEKLSTGEYDALTMVHNETSTGVTSPLYEIAKVVKNHDVSFLVDTVSSMAGIKVEVDKLGIDVCLFGVQKAVALPPGLAVCSVSDRAMEKAKTVENRGYYFDFITFQKYLGKEQTPATPAISQLNALDYQLDKILDQEGLENRYKRHEEMGNLTRRWAKKNFALFPEEERYSSNTVTCVKNTREVDCSDLKQKLADKGYVFANGYGKIANKTFRIAHMGDRTVDELKEYLSDIDEILGL